VTVKQMLANTALGKVVENCKALSPIAKWARL